LKGCSTHKDKIRVAHGFVQVAQYFQRNFLFKYSNLLFLTCCLLSLWPRPEQLAAWVARLAPAVPPCYFEVKWHGWHAVPGMPLGTAQANVPPTLNGSEANTQPLIATQLNERMKNLKRRKLRVPNMFEIA
jgi:hypothetical protein